MPYHIAIITAESGQILKLTYISAQHSNVFGLLRFLSACILIRLNYYRDPITQPFLYACKQDHWPLILEKSRFVQLKKKSYTSARKESTKETLTCLNPPLK